MVLVEFRWQWWGSLPMLPGGGSGTTLITSPYLGRLFVEIDYCKEIGCDLSLILRPDIENLICSSAVVVLVLRFAAVFLPCALAVLSQRDSRCTEHQTCSDKEQPPRSPPPNSARFLHVTPSSYGKTAGR